MSDQRIQYDEEMVGAGHPTKSDTLNRLMLVEHNSDGTHATPSDDTAMIEGCGAHGDGTGTFKVSPGRVMIDGILCTIDSELSKTTSGLTAGIWHYVFAEQSPTLTDSNISISEGPGSWDETRKGFYSGDLRMIGVLRTVDGSSLIAASHASAGIFSFDDTPPDFYSTAPPSASWTVLTVDVPALGRLVCDMDSKIYKSGNAGLSTHFYNGDVSVVGTNHRGYDYSQNTTANSHQFNRSFRIVTNASQQMLLSGQTDEYVYLQCQGFKLPRSLGRD